MIRIHTAIRHNLLQRHANRRTATPDSYDQRRLETTFENLEAQLKGIFQQILCGEYGLVHRRAFCRYNLDIRSRHDRTHSSCANS